MALIWCEGFDHYGGDIEKLTDGAWAETHRNNPDKHILTTNGRTGTYCLRRGKSANDFTARRVLNQTVNHVGVGFAVYMSVLPPVSNRAVLVDFRDTQNMVNITICCQSDGNLAVYRGDNIAGTLLGTTASPVMVAESYQHVEAQVVSDSLNGAVEVRVNGVPVINISGVGTICSSSEMYIFITTLPDGVQGIAQVSFPGRTVNDTTQASFALGSSFLIDYDDIYAYDTTGAFNNTWLGDRRVYTLFPNQDTAVAEWTPLSGNGYANIDGPTDDDSTYISAGVPGSPDDIISEFELEDLPKETGIVSAITIVQRARKEEAGTADLRSAIISNGVDAEGVIHPLNPAYVYHEDVYEYDPDTGAAFLPDAVDDLKVRVTRVS